MSFLAVMYLSCCLLRQFGTKGGFTQSHTELHLLKLFTCLMVVWGEGKEGEETVALRLQGRLATSAARNRNGIRSAWEEKAPRL